MRTREGVQEGRTLREGRNERKRRRVGRLTFEAPYLVIRVIFPASWLGSRTVKIGRQKRSELVSSFVRLSKERGTELTSQQPRQLSLLHRRSNLNPDGVLQPSEVLDVSSSDLSRSISDPEEVGSVRKKTRTKRRVSSPLRFGKREGNDDSPSIVVSQPLLLHLRLPSPRSRMTGTPRPNVVLLPSRSFRLRNRQQPRQRLLVLQRQPFVGREEFDRVRRGGSRGRGRSDGSHEVQGVRESIDDVFELLLEDGRADVGEGPGSRSVEGGEVGGEESSDVVEGGGRVEVGTGGWKRDEGVRWRRREEREREGETNPRSRSGSGARSDASKPLMLSPL